ncbi:curlin [Devosia rhodophyticola]|uniref:Curlin n=1 Tax=Devosia rhodophyticola TaxID=3026423 RepID=A0ABY7Z0I9_9HYPH|nr:curlin [Devosia rhodophyticola]WDR06992.1 curlin [Devosia rhodophyticola]
MIKKFATAAVLALTIGTAGLATIAPATAGGQVSISFAPSDPEQAEALGMGLQMFSIVKGLSGQGADVSQNGNFNAAGIAQNGSGNHGLVVQEGDGHTGTINQDGNNNSCGLFQFGENTNAQCAQTGNNQSSVTTVFGF